MKKIIVDFLSEYLNSSNMFFVTITIMLILLITYIIISILTAGSLKKIVNVLRHESGSGIIRGIEELKLSKRYNQMWEDYYEAYLNENTVSLNNYLIKADLSYNSKIFKMANRAVAVVSFCFTALCIYRIPNLYELEKINLLCLFFVLVALVAVLEVVYTCISEQNHKRIKRLIEEFEMLSVRKLPGKAVSFEEKYTIETLDDISEKIQTINSNINQTNLRLDRQYKFITDNKNQTINEENDAKNNMEITEK